MKRYIIAAAAVVLAVTAHLAGSIGDGRAQAPAPATAPPAGQEVATFATGCFWCTESDFDKVAGVTSTVSGYMGGHTKNPTYQHVSSGKTGHTEVLQVTYDPRQVSYTQLLDVFWRNVDPLDKDGQFCDRGSHYRPAVFYHNEAQQKAAADSKAALDASKRFNKPIVVEVTAASEFTRAEEYHQDYYKKEPLRYGIYRYGCGRDARLEALWGKK
jgi:peptide-methionine (S)-S-oxide reductase